MFEIVRFYFSNISKIFDVYNSWEIFPGVSYFSFFAAFIIISVLLSFLFHNVKEEFDHKISLGVRARRANELSSERKYRREKYGE